MLSKEKMNELFSGTKYPILNNKYALTKKVGSGATCIVKLGRKRETGELVAVKILTPKGSAPDNKHHVAEVKMLSKLSHPNIVRLIDFGRGTLKKPNGNSKEVDFIVLEYAENGELFDYIYFPKKGFSENIARYIFKMLIDGLESCHNSGVAHRDLKSENIMMDSDWTLKIADFGYSTNLNGKKGTGLLDSFLGTMSYVSPEILNHQSYMGTCSDIFSCGVILFVLVTGKMPFGKAGMQDPYYKYFTKCEYEHYWALMKKKLPPLSDEFKGLLNLLLAFDPTQRPTINEIKNHEWMFSVENNENFVDLQAKVVKQFEKRKKVVTEMKLLEAKNLTDNSTSTSMDIDDEAYTSDTRKCKDYTDATNPYKFKLNCDDYKKVFCCLGKYFKNCDKNKKKIIKPHDSMCKIEITYELEDDMQGSLESIIEPLKFCITVKKCEYNKLMVEFCKISGDKQEFVEIYEGFLQCIESQS